jgi:hypothetical protein
MRCKGKTKQKRSCRNQASSGSSFCQVHRPARARREATARNLVFSHALYYPHIEVPDEGWLKNAALYWDTISTIVPRGFPPYRSETSTELRGAGILSPLEVTPDLPEVRDLEEEAVEFLYTAEAQHVLRSSPRGTGGRRSGAYLHPDKMAHRVRHELFGYGTRRDRGAAWQRVPEPFAAFYMTLLATRLARERGKALLTNSGAESMLASTAMLGAGAHPYRYRSPAATSEGLLAAMTLQTVRIGASTPVSKVLAFRDQHHIELGRFRASIRELTKSLKGSASPEALAAHVQTTYSDEVQPTLDELRSKLRENRIRCGFNNLRLSTLASASPTALGAALAGTAAGPFALVAGLTLSVVLATANYRSERRQLLRGNPFSYVLSAEQVLGKATRSSRRR